MADKIKQGQEKTPFGVRIRNNRVLAWLFVIGLSAVLGWIVWAMLIFVR